MHFDTEADYQEALAKYLACTGWEVEVEITFKAANNQVSRLDILATKGNHTLLIEAKRDAENSKIRKAIGQLIRYSTKFPDAELWFACPDKLTEAQRIKLISYGIKPIPTEHLPLEKYIHAPVTVFKGKVNRKSNGAISALVKVLPRDLQQTALQPIKNRICMVPMCGGSIRAKSYELYRSDDFVETFKLHGECVKCKAAREFILVHRPKLESFLIPANKAA